MISAQSKTSQLYGYISRSFRQGCGFFLTSLLYSIEVVIVALILVVIAPSKISAQVVINELSTNTSSDWVELYSSEDVDISGWILRDNASSIMKTIPDGIVLTSTTSSYIAIDVGNRLNNSGDKVKIYLPDDDTPKDEVSYGDQGGVCLPGDVGSIGRYPDGNSTIERFSNHSKGGTNASGVIDSCPTPTPQPLATNIPALKPTPTLTLTPKKTPIPTVKITLTNKPKITPRDDNNQDRNSENTVLGLRNELTPSPTPVIEEGEKRKFPLAAGFLIFGGLAFMGAASYPFIKNTKFIKALPSLRKREYNLFSGESRKNND